MHNNRENSTYPTMNNQTRSTRFLSLTAAAYLIYGVYMLVESFDFLAMLHSKPPDFHPTYSLVNVVYYIMEMIICISLGFGCLLLRMQQKVVVMLVLILLFRIGIVYYLYFFTEPEYRWVPYIYKVGNDASKGVRVLFISLQLLFGIGSIMTARKRVTPTSGSSPDLPLPPL